MNELDNIRLNRTEKNALIKALKDIDDEVYLLGSRLKISEKGGDIDLLVYSKKNSLNLSQKIVRSFFKECEEKIDVLVFDKDNLSDEQEAFINTLRLRRIK